MALALIDFSLAAAELGPPGHPGLPLCSQLQVRTKIPIDMQARTHAHILSFHTGAKVIRE